MAQLREQAKAGRFKSDPCASGVVRYRPASWTLISTPRTRAFAARINAILNGTVTNGVQLNVVLSASGVCWVGYRISKQDLNSKPFGLTISQKSPAAHMIIAHQLKVDDEGRYLTDEHSSVSVYSGPEPNDTTS